MEHPHYQIRLLGTYQPNAGVYLFFLFLTTNIFFRIVHYLNSLTRNSIKARKRSKKLSWLMNFF